MKAIVLSATLLALVATPACKRDHRDAKAPPSANSVSTGTTTTTEGVPPATSAAPADTLQNNVPRSASEAQQRRDEGSVGPFGPAPVPAPVAPTSPAEKTAPAK